MELRRTMLYVPGNNAGMIKDAHIYRPDSIMFDLEDSVSLREKDAARFLVFNALKTLFYDDIEKVVRVNGLDTPFGIEDVNAMVAARVDTIRLPKTETVDDITQIETVIEAAEKKYGLKIGFTQLIAAIESAKGILNIREIAQSSPRLVGIAIGAEDYVKDLHTTRSADGVELLVARSMLVMAARSAGIMALDTVYSDINNEEGFEKEVRSAKQLGFDGKSVIHPNQIPIVNGVFTPNKQEIEYAIRVISAIKAAEAKGSGVISMDGKMVDKPIVERAQRTLGLARASGIDAGTEVRV